MAAPQVARFALAVAVAVFTVSCQPSEPTAKPATPVPSPSPPVVPAGYGVVVGGIDPCVGPPTRTPPQYAWGTVLVLQGPVTEQPGAGVQQPVLPTEPVIPTEMVLVASAAVAEGGKYRFTLPPGQYVLAAQYKQWQTGWPWVSVPVVAGQITRQDIPSPCF